MYQILQLCIHNCSYSHSKVKVWLCENKSIWEQNNVCCSISSIKVFTSNLHHSASWIWCTMKQNTHMDININLLHKGKMRVQMIFPEHMIYMRRRFLITVVGETQKSFPIFGKTYIALVGWLYFILLFATQKKRKCFFSGTPKFLTQYY